MHKCLKLCWVTATSISTLRKSGRLQKPKYNKALLVHVALYFWCMDNITVGFVPWPCGCCAGTNRGTHRPQRTSFCSRCGSSSSWLRLLLCLSGDNTKRRGTVIFWNLTNLWSLLVKLMYKNGHYAGQCSIFCPCCVKSESYYSSFTRLKMYLYDIY